MKGRSWFADGMDRRMVAPARHAIAATGAWTADDTYQVKLCLYETPFYIRYEFKFREEELLIDSEYNVAFGPTAQPQLVGSAPSP